MENGNIELNKACRYIWRLEYKVQSANYFRLGTLHFALELVHLTDQLSDF